MGLSHRATDLDSKVTASAFDTFSHFSRDDMRSAVARSNGRKDYAASMRHVRNDYFGSGRKRLLDVALACVMLLLALPLLLLLTLLVKLSSEGPVIFKQARNGKGGREFNIYKFRSMYHVPEEAGSGVVKQASRNDKRVTRIGYWMRRLSLDELPQLLNVLQGKMSLVGPRPHALSHDEYYSKHVHGYMKRYACQPGITGLAQVSGARGETESHADMQQRINLDLEYIAQASLRTDLVIIGRTVLKLLDSREVY